MKSMVSPQYLPGRRPRNAGVALVLVLAFVVIITGVILAFFSQSLFTRQISDASANQVKADLLAQGASESIIADLQQEILLTSSASIFTVGSGTNQVTTTYYTPSAPKYMLPQLSGTNITGGNSNVTWAPNFLIRSASGQLFFTGTSTGSATIPTSGSSSVIAVSSTTPSLNGRTVSLTRWNSHYLLPLSGSATDSTPAISSTSYFQAPDWVLVTRSGSSPGSWNATLANPSISNSSYVIGRYAYAVYHEGGLLDANVAGYPIGTDPSAPVSGTSQIGYKPAVAYADLTQLPGGFLNNPNAVNQLVAWRNYASAVVSGTSLQAPAFSAGFSSNYFNHVLNNPTGFLSVSSTALNNNGQLGNVGQSDRMFGSRQELIGFMKNGLGWTGPQLNALNYMATFTRGVNQPTYAPYAGRPLIQASGSNGGNNAVGQDAASPQVSNPINPSFLSVRVSGTGFTRYDGTQAIVGEPLVKKRFALSKIAWLTYLGPSASRLVPLGTYNPVGLAKPAPNDPNYDLWALVNLYGVPLSYLQQGTPTNIQNYFGLVWQQDQVPVPGAVSGFHDGELKWFYQGHNEQGSTSSTGQGATSPSVSNTAGAISRIVDVGKYGAREPDFFELLKASVVAGSKAMSSMNISSIASLESQKYTSTIAGIPAYEYHPYWYQAQRDTSLDYAIIQLGANIIDQAKVDGYSTRIVFNDGGSAHEFRGVENLPYLYRLNSATLKLRGEDCGANQYLPTPTYLTDYQLETGPIVLKDTGVGLIMDMPTIWNPYNANSPLGYPAPAGPGVPSTITPVPTAGLGDGDFRLIADSVSPDNIVSNGTTGYTCFNANTANNAAAGEPVNETSNNQNVVAICRNLYTTSADGAGSLITPGLALTPPLQQPLYPGDAQLTFAVPNSTYFREPTVLARPNVPSGCNLQMAPPSVTIPQYNSIFNHAGNKVWQSNNSFLSDSPNPLDLPTPPIPANTGYIGICVALYPIVYAATASSGTYITMSDHIILNVSNGAGPFVTYRMQYKDPNPNDPSGSWETYDEKYNVFNTAYLDTAFGTGPGVQSGGLTNAADKSGGDDWRSYTDPRTSRFAGINGKNMAPGSGNKIMTPGGDSETQEWPDAQFSDDDVTLTDRPDTNAGYAISDDRPTGSGAAIIVEFSYLNSPMWTVGAAFYRDGLLSQNSSQAADNSIRFNGDNALNNGTTGLGPTYYKDPDGVTRGAMGNYVAVSPSAPAATTIGLPLATAYNSGSPATNQPTQEQSRPYFLHRPFRSVGELGYVFSGTPWKNIDFFTPQSGDAALLDVFSAYETPINPHETVAGVVNLNTRQEPVLQALLTGAYVDEAVTSGTGSTSDAKVVHPFTGPEANSILTAASGGATSPNFLARTSPANTVAGQGPLQNVSELVGRWVQGTTYNGPSADLTNLFSAAYGAGSAETMSMQNIDRFREAFLRPLAAVANTRVWNLLIDVVAQTGRYPQGATNPANFVVDGEQRYWVHVAIDRYTGQVVDKQVEVVKD